MRRTLLLAFVSLLVPIASAQVYTITDLGELSPTAINTWEEVAGNVDGHAVLWTPLGRRDLGILPGGTFSSAAAINDLGVVVGTADGAGTVISEIDGIPNQECSDLTQPFVWMPGKGMKSVGGFGYGGGAFSTIWCTFPYDATGINDRGQLVGYTYGPNFYMYALLWTRADGITLFGESFPPTMANGVSNTGEIVGSNGNDEAAIAQATSWMSGVTTDLESLGGDVWDYASSANGVNDRGQVVGWSTTTTVTALEPCCPNMHAVLWPVSGGILDLGTLPGDTFSEAFSINFYGQIIGSSGNTFDYQPGGEGYSIPIVIGRPFIWTKSGGMQDLNTLIPASSGWVLNSATGINIWGQIVGSGTRNGKTQGFLLTPRG
jgi:probable HAF family extracellular repeat protein